MEIVLDMLRDRHSWHHTHFMSRVQILHLYQVPVACRRRGLVFQQSHANSIVLLQEPMDLWYDFFFFP